MPAPGPPNPRDAVPGRGTPPSRAARRRQREWMKNAAKQQPVEPSVPPAWYPDPTSPGWLRWWDGYGWRDSRTLAPPMPPPSSPPAPGRWPPPAAPGWYPDPTTGRIRWWDGGQWGWAAPDANARSASVRPRGRWNGLATASFVLSLLWLFWIGSALGVILGLAALRQIKRSEQRGKGLAIAGVVLGVLWILALIDAYLGAFFYVGAAVEVLAVAVIGLVVRRPLVISRSETIHAATASVFAVLADHDQLAALNPGTVLIGEAEDLATGGFRVRASAHWHRLGYRFTVVTEEYDPPSTITFASGEVVRSLLGKLLSLRISDRVKWVLASAEEATLATVTVTWRRVPVGSLWLMAPLARHQLGDRLRRLQRAVTEPRTG